MRAWYVVIVGLLLAICSVVMLSAQPAEAYDWLLVVLPIVWVLLSVMVTRAASLLSGRRIRAGVESTLIVSMPIGALLGFVGGALTRMVDGFPNYRTLSLDTLVWFAASAAVSLAPSALVGALIAFAIPNTWINHISPFKRLPGSPNA